MIDAFRHVWMDQQVGVVLLTGNGPRPKMASTPSAPAATSACAATPATSATTAWPRLNVLELQRIIRTMPKVVIALVEWLRHRRRPRAARHVRPDHRRRQRHLRPDRADRRQLRRRLRLIYLASIVGQKKAREIWYLCRQYTRGGAGNGPGEQGRAGRSVGGRRRAWAQEILEKSPIAIRFLKAAFNADLDGQTGLQVLAGDATMLYYMTEEGREGKEAFLERRKPDFGKYPWRP
jgi:naphthoate synthase